LVAVTVGVPSLLNVFGLQGLADQADSATRLVDSGSDGTLWVTFWTLLGGFIAAGIGGMIGGAFTRAESIAPVVVHDAAPVTRTVPRTATTPTRTDDQVVVEDDVTAGR
jgi:ABC-type nitrate/sulfonate/bicarbonate transport system permease component